MSRLVLLALLANVAGAALQKDDPDEELTIEEMETRALMEKKDIESSHFSAAKKLSSFEMGCYYETAPVGEKGGDKGRSYRGLVSYTESGRTCRNWVSDNKWSGAGETPTPDEEDDDGNMKWGNGIGNHNYCRNPNPKTSGFDKPWCFTQDPKREKEACNIDPCPSGDKDKPDYYPNQAKKLWKTMKGAMSLPECACADQTYGSSDTTMDTRVKFLQTDRTLSKMMARKNMGLTRDGKPCFCRH